MGKQKPRIRSLGWVAMGLALLGCQADPRPEFRTVAQETRDRTGREVRWKLDAATRQEADRMVRQLLERELTVWTAVQIALLNNPGLQKTFEEIGIDHAAYVQAGLLRNPAFFTLLRFPDRPPSNTNLGFSLWEDVLDLLIMPLRKKAAAEQLEATRLRISDEVIGLVRDVRRAYYSLQAVQESLEVDRSLLAELRLPAGPATPAGQVPTNAEIVYRQAQLEVTQSELRLRAGREALTRLLGLRETAWRISDTLPPIPRDDGDIRDPELLAITRRLDLVAARQQVQSLATALKLARDFRYLRAVNIGVNTEMGTGRQRVTGPFWTIELPLFDQSQARIADLESRLRSAERDYDILEVTIRSEVRQFQTQMVAARQLAEFIRDYRIPFQRRAVRRMEDQVPQLGIGEDLQIRQDATNANRSYILAWRDYAIARAELERAVGGRLVWESATQPTTTPATQPAP